MYYASYTLSTSLSRFVPLCTSSNRYPPLYLIAGIYEGLPRDCALQNRHDCRPVWNGQRLKDGAQVGIIQTRTTRTEKLVLAHVELNTLVGVHAVVCLTHFGLPQ